jgi:hypothetical protein
MQTNKPNQNTSEVQDKTHPEHFSITPILDQSSYEEHEKDYTLLRVQ